MAYKRGRDFLHSPDPDYFAKRLLIEACFQEVLRSEGKAALVFLDEVGYSRQPSLAQAYEEKGAPQPLAPRSYRSNTETRIVGVLDPLDGRVVFHQGAHITIPTLVAFFQRLRNVYSERERLYVVCDNWPVHFHPDVLVALEPQEFPFPLHLPQSWSTEPTAKAKRKWSDWKLPIRLVTLPTYAPWLNPIEKLWRWLRQTVIHLHRLADDLETLRDRSIRFLEAFASGSSDLLRYVGLSDPQRFFTVARSP